MGFSRFTAREAALFAHTICDLPLSDPVCWIGTGVAKEGGQSQWRIVMRIAIFIWFLCLAACVPVFAESAGVDSLAEIRGVLKELRVEHRTRMRAHRLVAEMGLFDEFDTLGRTVIPQVKSSVDGILASGDREELVGTVEGIAYKEPGVEISGGGEFLTQIGREIEALQDTIRSLERSALAMGKGAKE